MTYIQKAAIFYYMIRTSYGASLKQYGANYRSPYLLLRNIEVISKRLARIVIENKDFKYIV
ncbi:hypothetical protein [Clostridium sp. MD294]|uniref:hypothetical protein n=1 Tax=Clostridium sp. MD294 TaxID=97138 RepID=UPI0003A2CC5B|nr:hypothetical protein [Clostridium sp. MD294]